MITTKTIDNSSKPRVIEIDPASDPRWDDFVRANKHATFYHLGVWQDVLRQTYGYRPHCLATEKPDGTLGGLLPLNLVRSPLTGTRLVSLPFSDVCGPIADDADDLRALLARACTLGESYHARYLQIRSAYDDLAATEPRLTADARYLDFEIPLADDAAVVWSRPKLAEARRHVRRAIRNGVTVEESNDERGLAVFYRLHQLTTKKHGMPAQSFTYFRNLWRLLGRSCALRLFLAWHEGRTVAASLFVGFQGTAYYVYNASDPTAIRLDPNHLLVWEAIQWACRDGYQAVSLGKASVDNPGLIYFKREWGADGTPVRYYYYPKVHGLTSTAYSEKSARHHAVTRLWRALPAPLTNAVGTMLYGHLA